METIADIMKMDREKQSRPINTAEVFVERSLVLLVVRCGVYGDLLQSRSTAK